MIDVFGHNLKSLVKFNLYRQVNISTTLTENGVQIYFQWLVCWNYLNCRKMLLAGLTKLVNN